MTHYLHARFEVKTKGSEHWCQIQKCSRITPKSCCVVLCASHNKKPQNYDFLYFAKKTECVENAPFTAQMNTNKT